MLSLKTDDLNFIYDGVDTHPGKIFFALKERRFELKDLSVDIKTYRDWLAQKILPATIDNEKNAGKKVMLNYYEAMWLMLIADLRTLGIRYNPHLQFFKENAWRDSNSTFPKSWLLAYQEFKYPGNSDLQAVIANTKDSDIEDLTRDIPGFKVYGFEFRIFQDLYESLTTRFFIRSDKKIGMIVTKDAQQLLPPYFDEKLKTTFNDEVFVEIPLLKYINRFVNDDILIKRQRTTNYLSKEEEELLKVIRSGDIKSLKIHFDNEKKKPLYYQIEKDKDLSQEEFAAVKGSILLKNYEQITYKAKKGGGVYYTKEIVKRFK